MTSPLVPLLDLWNLPGLRESLDETARIFFSSNSITVNLIPAFLLGLLGLFLLKPLFGIPILSQIFGAMTGGSASYGSNLEISDGYGAPSGGYGAPAPSYGAPAPSYGAPAPSYSAPASGYDAPASGYDSPSSGYDSPSSGYDAPTDGYSAGRRKRAVELPREARDLYASLDPYSTVAGLDTAHYQDSAAFLHNQPQPAANIHQLLN